MGSSQSRSRKLNAEESSLETKNEQPFLSTLPDTDSPLLRLPEELLVIIIDFIDDLDTFQNIALTSRRLSWLCADMYVLARKKSRFTQNAASLLDLILIPGEERVLIQHSPVLPCGWKHGEELVWNHAVRLQLMIRDGGVCLQGLIDVKDKKIAHRRHWQDDRMVGEEEKFFSNGQREYSRHYDVQGLLDGEEQFWYEDGTLKERNFRRNGILEGVQQAWFADGSPSLLRMWRDGNLEGVEKQWNESGELITHIEWPVHQRGKRKDLLQVRDRSSQPKLRKRDRASRFFSRSSRSISRLPENSPTPPS